MLRFNAVMAKVVGLRVRTVAIGAMATLSDEIDGDLRGAVVIGGDRTPYQDLEFAIRRIVELARRSLSTGINDLTTALYCIDRLGQVLGRLA